MSAVTFFTDTGQPAFTTETRTGDYIVRQVLGAREPSALEISAEFTQTRADYARPAPNTTLTYDNGAGSDVTAYFVDDVEFEQLGGGVQKWTRTWATIPATWQEPGGTFAFTFPSYVSGIAFGSFYSVTDCYANGNYYNLMTNAANISAADTFFLDLNYVRSNQNYHVSFQTSAKFAGDGTRVPIAKLLPGNGTFSGVTGTMFEARVGRSAPETIEVDSILLHEYVLGDETSIEVLLPQIDKFSPVGALAVETNELSTGTATVPNSATYASMVAAGTLIPARRSDRAIYMGNIYERTTLLVAAR